MRKVERITQEKRDLLIEFIMQHPKVIAAIGYGSGVIEQLGNDPKDTKEMDMILIVPDILEWMRENLIQHPEEFTRMTMEYFKKAKQKDLEKGAPIVYFSHILFRDKYLKFGVISERQFLDSCYKRTSSYVPFRIEKPIVELFSRNPSIHDAILYDRKVTLMTSLLMLDQEKKRKRDLMIKICSLSYMGDFRMKWHCEDPNKIKNLVDGQLSYFMEDYHMVNDGYYQEDSHGFITVNYEKIEQDLAYAPEVIKKTLKGIPIDSDHTQDLNRQLEKFYIRACEKEAFSQAIKGICTNGIQKSFTYGLRKAKKGRCKKSSLGLTK